tara:strand:- start:480 stop:692 length:213 start_codon:yes stop_codon:yes gene_type:complete
MGENLSTQKIDRRKALARLGLGTAVAYVAPTVLHLDRSANAVTPSCNNAVKGNPWCGGSGGKSGSKGKGK